MNKVLKIFLLLIAVFPLWLTIVAMASAPTTPDDQWRHRLNKELLKVEDQRIQIVEMLPTLESLPAEALQLPLRLDLSKVDARSGGSIGVKAVDEHGRLLHYAEFPARFLVQLKVPVARKDLKRGEKLEPADVEWKWMEATGLGRSSVMSENSTGNQMKSFVAAGDIIYSRQVESGQSVRRGDRVKVNVLSSGINISTYGVAQESGRYGQTIRILNPESKKEIYGVVTSGEEVEVRL